MTEEQKEEFLRLVVVNRGVVNATLRRMGVTVAAYYKARNADAEWAGYCRQAIHLGRIL